MVASLRSGVLIAVSFGRGKAHYFATAFFNKLGHNSYTVHKVLGIVLLVASAKNSEFLAFERLVLNGGQIFVPIVGQLPVEPGGNSKNVVVVLLEIFQSSHVGIDFLAIVCTQQFDHFFYLLVGFYGAKIVNYAYLLHIFPFGGLRLICYSVFSLLASIFLSVLAIPPLSIIRLKPTGVKVN